MSTGENEMGLRKILDMTRFASIFILLLHCYFYCYAAFKQWQLSSDITDRLLVNIQHMGLFNNQHNSKLITLGLLAVSLMGTQGRKNEKLVSKTILVYLLVGLLLFLLAAYYFM